MFCPSCGSQIPDGSAFCPTCGTNAMQANAPAAAPAPQPYQQQPQQQPYQQQPQYQQPQYQQPQQQYGQPYQQQGGYPQPPASMQQQYGQPAMGAQANYTSLGGWLLFFVIVYILDAVVLLWNGFSGMSTMGLFTSYFGSEIGGILMFSNICNILIGAAIVFYIVLIFKKNPLFLKVYQIVGAVSIVLNLISLIWFNSAFGEMLSNYGVNLAPSMIFSILLGALGIFLMTMYYCKSVRVRTYMGSTDYQRQAIFRIGA